jgi:hypothetical protein
MIEASCHCGGVQIVVPYAPETVTECNCSICRRTGGQWGYYRPAEVTVRGATDTYQWGDRTLDLHRCRVCGNITHWSGLDPTGDRMGVNARLMPPEVLRAARVRKFDGADTWTTIEG